MKEKCPLCDLEANYNFVEGDGNKRKKFNCPKCKMFVITDTAEGTLNTSMSEYKDEFSKACSELSDRYLMHIYVPPIETNIPLKAVPEERSHW